jgi:hypothetical protein
MRSGKAWGTAAFGSAVLAATFFFCVQAFGVSATWSTFPKALASPPLIWWPLATWLGLAASCLVMLWGVVSGFVVPRVPSPALAATVSTVACLAILAGATVYERQSGVALYADRLVLRSARSGFSLNTVRYDDVRSIRVGCGYGRHGRSIPIYEAILETGERLELDKPSFQFLPDPVLPSWVSLMAPINEAIRAGGAEVKVVNRSHGGVSCTDAFAKDLDLSARRDWRRLVRAASR